MNKIKEEQLSKIQEQQKTLNNILHEVGILETQKHGKKINTKELRTQLENEYGVVNINIEDGTYTEIEKVEEKITSDV